MSEMNSRLWKSAALAESKHFPQLVRAAAEQEDEPFTDGLLKSVAADPALLAAIVWPAQEGMDATLSQMAQDPVHGPELDDLIIAAVRGHSTPEGA